MTKRRKRRLRVGCDEIKAVAIWSRPSIRITQYDMEGWREAEIVIAHPADLHELRAAIEKIEAEWKRCINTYGSKHGNT